MCTAPLMLFDKTTTVQDDPTGPGAQYSGTDSLMFNNTRFYSKHGNLSYEFDDEHQDHELAAIEFDLLTPHLKNIDTALHLFCGAGRHLAVFAKNGIHSTGIDISPFLIHRASTLMNLESPRFKASAHSVIGDALHIPFAENIFKCVTALGNSFSLLSDDQVNQVFYQTGQVMKRGGVFILDIPDFEQIKNSSSPFTNPINVCREIYSKDLGPGLLTWHRYHDPKNNGVSSKETLVFNRGRVDEKKIESHFFFHIILPRTLCPKAEALGMEVVDIMKYQDKRGKYRGMLAKRIFMVFKKK